jgi:hypothetical protein
MSDYKFLDKGHPDHYRQEEIKMLAQAIRSRENRLVLGLPGMGVSNLLRFLVSRDNLIGRAEVTFAFLDCDTLGEGEGAEAFFDALAKEIEAKGLGDKALAGERGYKRLEWLVKQMERDPADRLAMVVDKADAMLASASKTFYRQLKALTDLNKRVCFVIAVSPLLAAAIDPEKLLFAGRWLPVGPLNERDCKGAIAEEAKRRGTEFNVAAQRVLARLTGGYPALLRAVSSAVDEEKINFLEAEELLVDRLLRRGDVKGRCEILWEALDQDKRDALLYIAAGRPDEAVPETLAWLQKYGMLDKSEEVGRIFSPIFAASVNQHPMPPPATMPPAPPSLPPLYPVRIDNGQVYKDGEEIKLRPLAYKLLEYFLKNQERILNHDQIIKHVWGGQAHTRFGRSSQDVQNLVRELRQELGNSCIKTYPRRGYMFTFRGADSGIPKDR